MMILFLLIIGVVVYFLVKNGGSIPSGRKAGNQSVDILKQRYVNGEINDAEYARMLKIIKD